MSQRETRSAAQWLRLFSMATAGDAAAENLFFDVLRRRLVAIARHLLRTRDVEDVVQDALIVVHRKYRRLGFDASAQDPAGFDRWCRRILHHRIGNDIRRRRFESEHRVSADHLLTVCSAESSDRLCETTERRDLLQRALKHLSATQRSHLSGGSRPPVDPRLGRDARYARTYRARRALWHALQIEQAGAAATDAPAARRRT